MAIHNPLHIGPGQGTAAFTWRVNSTGHEATCVIGVDCSDAVATVVGDIAQAIADAWTGAFELTGLSNSWTLARMKLALWPTGNGVTSPSSTPSAPVVGEVAINQLGTQSDDHLPPNCAALVKKVTALGGKANHGKLYLPACYITENEVSDGGVMDTSLLPSLQAKMDQFMENLTDSAVNIVPVLLHHAPRIAGAFAGDAPLATPVTNFIVDALLATQRRRMRS